MIRAMFVAVASALVVVPILAILRTWPNPHWAIIRDATRRFIPPNARTERELEWIAEVETMRPTAAGRIWEALNIWLGAPNVGENDRQRLYISSQRDPGNLDLRLGVTQPLNRAAKRALDVSVTLLAMLVAAPLLLASAAAVMIETRGPAFQAHERIGRDGRTFRLWKLRTRALKPELEIANHLAASPDYTMAWATNHKHNSRFTRVGRILRRLSLDELPQLWNVLKGDMSLVGPRPILHAHIAQYGDAFKLYAITRPGVTGYWQISISRPVDAQYAQRAKLDSFYVRHWSVWFDVAVLLKTMTALLKRNRSN